MFTSVIAWVMARARPRAIHAVQLFDPLREAYERASGQGRQGIAKRSLRSSARSRYRRGVLRGLREIGAGALPLLWKPKQAQLFAAAFAGGEDVTGQRSTTNITANILEIDMREKILELEPDASPLLILSKKAEATAAINPKFFWMEDKLNARFDKVSTEATKEETKIKVAAPTLWAADDLAYNTRTGETIRVTSTEAEKIVVVRGVGSTAAVIKANDELVRVGSAAQEGALDKPARSKNPVEVENYTQIFREPIDATATQLATRDRTQPRDWDRAMNHAGIEHAKDIEYAAMLGHPSIDLTGTNARRTTGGFKHYASQNITAMGGEMTETEWWNGLTPAFRYGSRTKLGLAGSTVMSIITTYPRSKVVVTQPDPSLTYGIHVVQMITPHGKILNLVTHWLMEGVELSKEMWVVDLANLGYKYLNGDEGNRDTHIKHNIQAPGQDGKKDEYLTECGFVYGQALTHGRLTEITS